ncbi:MAG: hypothetical protein KDE31_18880, partial [Caldilineaceae bacterium]|nr:hypothetical protein [Caldilineaceae bacterium]
MRTLAAALTVAHDQGMTHGNLSPSTIYIEEAPIEARGTGLRYASQEPTVLLGDFYTAPVTVAAHLAQTQSGAATTPTAAEQQEGAGESLPSADGTTRSDRPQDGAPEMFLPVLVHAPQQGQPDEPEKPSLRLTRCRWPVSPYMAPEQARDDETIDASADIYSLGALAYLLLLGRPPFSGSDPIILLSQVADRLPTPPERVDDAISPGIAYVLQAVLAKDAGTRYGTTQEFIKALEQGSRWVAATPSGAAAPGPSRAAHNASRQPVRQRRGALLAAALLTLLLITAASILASNPLRATLMAVLTDNPALTTEDEAPQETNANSSTAQDLTPIVMLTLTVSQVTPTPTGVIRIVGETTPGAVAAGSVTGTLSTTVTLVASSPVTPALAIAGLPTSSTLTVTTSSTISEASTIEESPSLTVTTEGTAIAALPVARSLTKTDNTTGRNITTTPEATAVTAAAQPTAAATNTSRPTATPSLTLLPTATASRTPRPAA